MPAKLAAARDSDSQRVRWLLLVVMIDLSAVALVRRALRPLGHIKGTISPNSPKKSNPSC